MNTKLEIPRENVFYRKMCKHEAFFANILSGASKNNNIVTPKIILDFIIVLTPQLLK